MEPALEAHRLHFAFAVTFHYLFPQLTMGLAADRRRTLQPGIAILGADFRDYFCDRSGNGNSDGISVRNELGGLFEDRGRRNWADAGDGRRVFVSGERCKAWGIRELALATGKTVVRVVTPECDTRHLLFSFSH